MKKIFAIILSALLVLSFAASAFAMTAEIPADTQAAVAKAGTQITLDGELRVRGWYYKNIDSSAPKASSSEAWYDQRIRLGVDAKIAPSLQAYLQLESAGDGYGKNGDDRYIWGNFGAKPTSLTVLQSWMLYKGSGLLGIPTGLKIGHMPLALGEKQFFDHTKFGDDAIVFFVDPTKELHMGLVTIKFAGDNNSGALPAVPFAGSRFNNTDDLDGYVGVITYKLDDKNSVGLNYTFLNRSDVRFSHQNLGLHAKGNVSGLSYSAEADMQFGKTDYPATSKFKGYDLLANLGYMVDPVGVRASFAYGSGNKLGDSDTKAFTTYLDNQQHYTLVYEYNVAATSGSTSTGLNNTTYFNLGADVTPVKDVKASLDLYIIRASQEKVAGESKNAGWEVDGKVAYDVTKNFAYQVDAGYFKSGDFYGPDNKGATVLRHMVTLKF